MGIVIDQMRFEMLERYSTTLSDDGFKKLQAEGFSFNNCKYNYIPTYTGPGHASIFSGQNPTTHGIISNDWYDRSTNKMVYCVEDNEVKTIGSKGKSGNRSPKNFKSQSIADIIKQNDKSKTFGVSIKDRGAILPAGQKADGAFWLDETNTFVSSSYYGHSLPHWLKVFNEKGLASQYAQLTWNLSLSPSAYMNSDEDLRKCESNYLKKKPEFPYPLKEVSEKKGAGVIKYTPYGNTLLTDLALELIVNEELGLDEYTDFLSVSYSSTDYAGHAFGPRSLEVQDMYIKLDLEIARLIDQLDSQVGKGNYTLFLTSDHGAVDCPGTKANPNEYVDSEAIKARVDSICEVEYGLKLVSHISNFQIWFDHALINEMFLNVDDVAFVVAEKMIEYNDGKAFAQCWTKGDLMMCDEPTCLQFKNAFDEDLSGDAFFMTTEGYLYSSSNIGTSHGTGYSYDTHVPFILYGANVNRGSSSSEIIIQDIVPTLLNLIEVMPNTTFDGESRVNLMR